MADESKREENEKKKAERPERMDNAATSFGLEDHEATAQDPRVFELQHSRSAHVRRPSRTPKPTTSNPSIAKSPLSSSQKPPEATTAPEPKPAVVPPRDESPNAATSYGLEDQKACLQDPRVLNIRRPQPPKEPIPKAAGVSYAPADAEQTQSVVVFNPPPPAPVVPLPPPPRSAAPLPPAAPSVPPAPLPPAAPMPPAAPLPPPPEKAPEKAKPPAASKFTNTDVTFDPSKEFASKTTNTLGNLYTDDEEELPPPPLPIPVPVPVPIVKQPSTFDMDECFAFAVALVKQAGAFALAANKDQLPFTTKEHEKDLNTRTDIEVEEMIVGAIADKYSDHKIIAEEAVSHSDTGQVTLTNAPTWIIDPIDGTMNFVHHFPYYCISVALLVDKQTAFGIVFNPPLQEFYTARNGKGAKLNDEPMQTSGQETLKGAMVLQEYSSGMNESRTSASMENAKRLIKKTHALRSIGSSAMGLAMVASGVADAFYFFGLHVWDMAAGNILVTEAGGTVIDPAGGEVDIMSRRVLAAATAPLAIALSSDLVQNYPTPRDDEPRHLTEPLTKDFSIQTEFSDSSTSLGSESSKQTAYHNVQ